MDNQNQLKEYTISIDVQDLSSYETTEERVLDKEVYSTGTEVKFINLHDISVDNLDVSRDRFVTHWHNCPNKCEDIRQDVANHFDLDHVLPKGDCPIVGLSLFNFVPSCQVCNEKLKKKKTIGDDEAQRKKLSPTSDQYDFTNQVTIALRRRDGGMPELNCMQHASEYRLAFECRDKDYAKSVSMFRLNERYNYHKVEALRLQDLLSDYNGYITMLHQLFDGKGLGHIYTEDKIREDLFGENFYKNYHRCFGKLHEDIVKAFRKKRM